MYLGIEIGGTKLQLGVGHGDGSSLAELLRLDVDADRGAAGILAQIEQATDDLRGRHEVSYVGIGFGGPVDAAQSKTIRSHQIDGWEDVDLGGWLRQRFGLPVRLANDSDAASLAEARFGAGRDATRMFFVTVGTGVGGGFVIDGHIDGVGRPAIAEIGHLRPGLHADRPEMTVESLASGWGIAAAAQARISGDVSQSLEKLSGKYAPGSRAALRQRLQDARQADEEFVGDLLMRCDFEPLDLTAKTVAQAALEGNEVALEVLNHACQALGWAIAQVVTLLAPQLVVVGGGVSLIGQQAFFAPVRRAAKRYVFPPLADSFEIVPAELGELVVVHGALALAAEAARIESS